MTSTQSELHYQLAMQQQHQLMQQQQQQQQQAPQLSASSLVDLQSLPVASSPSPHSLLEVRCLLDNGAVGGIIGKGGNSVRQVREESQAFVSIVKADFRHVQERIMILKGTVEQIAAATKGIALLLIDTASRREERPVETAQLRLLVHKSAVGAIIGKGGESIRTTQSETGARVQVSNETLPSSSEKTVTLTGTSVQMYAAMIRVASQLLANPLKAGTKVFPYVPGNQVFAAPSAYGGQVGFAPQSNGNLHAMYQSAPSMQQSQFGGLIRPAHSAPTILSTQKIAIPTICCGSIIGKGGAVIRDLRAQSATNISISDPDEATPNERVVTLSGTPQGISQAVFLIRQLVEAYQPNAGPQTQTQQQQQQTQQQQQQQPQY